MLYEFHKLQAFQKLHESEINNVLLSLMTFRKFIDFITKTVYTKASKTVYINVTQ